LQMVGSVEKERNKLKPDALKYKKRKGLQKAIGKGKIGRIISRPQTRKFKKKNQRGNQGSSRDQKTTTEGRMKQGRVDDRKSKNRVGGGPKAWERNSP